MVKISKIDHLTTHSDIPNLVQAVPKVHPTLMREANFGNHGDGTSNVELMLHNILGRYVCRSVPFLSDFTHNLPHHQKRLGLDYP